MAMYVYSGAACIMVCVILVCVIIVCVIMVHAVVIHEWADLTTKQVSVTFTHKKLILY